MKNLYASSTSLFNKSVNKFLFIAGALVFGLGAASSATAAVTRSCDWRVTVNKSVKMKGTVSGTASTVFIARKNASGSALSCFDKATSSPNTVPSCSGVTGWNKSFARVLPSPAGVYEYRVTVDGGTGSGCSGTKASYIRK